MNHLQKLRQTFLSLMACLTLGTIPAGSFAAPASASKTKRANDVVYTEPRRLSLEAQKEESNWVSGCLFLAERRPEARYDAPVIYELLRQKDNYNKLGYVPSRFASVITGNKKNYYFPTEVNRQKKDVWCLYNEHGGCQITYYAQEKKPVRIYWYNILAESPMAIFEKPKEIPQMIQVPEALTQGLSAEDKKYVNDLLSVVNENMAFIGYVPFYKPDTNRSIIDFYDEANGCFIPEKYLLTGDVLDKLKKDMSDPKKKFEYVDLSHLELQKRLGHPVYRLFTYEGHEIMPVYTYQVMYVDGIKAQALLRNVSPGHLKHDDGFPFTRYSNMRYVDSLVQLQPGWDIVFERDMVLQTIREVQYKRAQKSLHIIFDGLKAEYALQQNHSKRKAILTSVIQDVKQLGQKWDKMLQSAIDDKKFLFSLTNPNGNRKDIEGFKFVPFQTTWGHKGEEFVTFLPRTKEEKEAYYKKSLERLKRKQEEKKKRENQKVRGS